MTAILNQQPEKVYILHVSESDIKDMLNRKPKILENYHSEDWQNKIKGYEQGY